MKFARAGKGRGLMRDRQRRQREASPPLRTRYPDIGALRVTFEFQDKGPFTPAPQVTTLHPPAPAYFVFPCPSSDCDGEFDLQSAITGMMSAGDAHQEGHCLCHGSRQGDAKHVVPCGISVKFRVEVVTG